jgi:hypothetical protein
MGPNPTGGPRRGSPSAMACRGGRRQVRMGYPLPSPWEGRAHTPSTRPPAVTLRGRKRRWRARTASRMGDLCTHFVRLIWPTCPNAPSGSPGSPSPPPPAPGTPPETRDQASVRAWSRSASSLTRNSLSPPLARRWPRSSPTPYATTSAGASSEAAWDFAAVVLAEQLAAHLQRANLMVVKKPARPPHST